MKTSRRILFIVGLLLMGVTAVALMHFKSRQHLGVPGLRCTTIPDDLRVNIELPLVVPGYVFSAQEPDEIEVNTLPPDTSLAKARYRDGADKDIYVSAVMMGSDRTSIHKPEICLPGQGFNIDDSRTVAETVRIDGAQPFNLPVKKVIASRTVEQAGRQATLTGVYVYWFVAEDAVTEDHNQRMWWMVKHLLKTGELQRWAYISYFSVCAPGDEEATFDRIKKLINLTVPEFQIARPASTQEQASIQ